MQDGPVDGNWKLLAEHAARRRAELGLSQIEVAQRGPLSLDRVQSIEGAKRAKYRLGTLLALERALAWAPGSVEQILKGGGPLPADEPPADPMGATEAILDDMDRRVADMKRLSRRDLAAVDALIQALKNPDRNGDPADNNRR